MTWTPQQLRQFAFQSPPSLHQVVIDLDDSDAEPAASSRPEASSVESSSPESGTPEPRCCPVPTQDAAPDPETHHATWEIRKISESSPKPQGSQGSGSLRSQEAQLTPSTASSALVRRLQATASPLRKRPRAEAQVRRPPERLARPGETDFELALRLQKEEDFQAVGSRASPPPSCAQTQPPSQLPSLQQRLLARSFGGAALPSLLSSSSSSSSCFSFSAASSSSAASLPSSRVRAASSSSEQAMCSNAAGAATSAAAPPGTISTSFGGLALGGVQLPLRLECFGTAREPVIVIRNVDGQRGKTLADMVQCELHRLGRPLPVPSRRGARAAIAVDWHRSKRSATPWKTGVRVLIDTATVLQDQLSKEISQRYPCLAAKRSWNDTEVLVTTPGCKLGKHRDAQPAGSLLFIFCCGLSCRSLSWPAGELVENVLESGDVMILDGKRTAHAVPAVLENTSPMPSCPWLGKRRMAVLVRQSPP